MGEGEYKVGAKALYQEDGARMVVEVVANNSKPGWFHYELKVLSPVRNGFFHIAPGAGDVCPVFRRDATGVEVHAFPTGTKLDVSKRSSDEGTPNPLIWNLSDLVQQ